MMARPSDRIVNYTRETKETIKASGKFDFVPLNGLVLSRASSDSFAEKLRHESNSYQRADGS